MAAIDVYVASSWRNPLQQEVVKVLRLRTSFMVYDFRHPNGPSSSGFAWSDIDPDWQNWTPAQYIAALYHPIAKEGYRRDITALKECARCILVLPSGRSAHLELGYAAGMGKECAILTCDGQEPELMAKMAGYIATDIDSLVDWAINV